MTRMSSPDGSEILTVDSEVGASVLASLGWSTEGDTTSSRRSEPTTPKTEPAEAEEHSSAESGEARRKRGPGRPRKHPVEGE